MHLHGPSSYFVSFIYQHMCLAQSSRNCSVSLSPQKSANRATSSTNINVLIVTARKGNKIEKPHVFVLMAFELTFLCFSL